MNFHHGSVHRHVGKGGLITGFNEHIYYHLEAGGLKVVNEYDANYIQVIETIDNTMQRVTVFDISISYFIYEIDMTKALRSPLFLINKGF